MAPKRDLARKTDPAAKKRKSITIKQKVDIIRRYERGESTNAIRLALGLPESMLRTIRKDKEKIMAAFKAGTGASALRVSSGQPEFMVRLKKMLVIWMDHRKRQDPSVTTEDAQQKALRSTNISRPRKPALCLILSPAGAGFKISRPDIPSVASSALERRRALMLTLLLLSRTSSGLSSEEGGGGGGEQAPADFQHG